MHTKGGTSDDCADGMQVELDRSAWVIVPLIDDPTDNEIEVDGRGGELKLRRSLWRTASSRKPWGSSQKVA